MTDILIVAHGGSKNDTLCTREVKVLDHPTEKDCPHIEVSIKCPHMITKGGKADA